MVLEGKKELFVTGHTGRTCSVGTVPLSLAVLSGSRGRFAPKKAALGRKMRSFERAPPNFPPPPLGATGEFWLKIWIWQGHHLGNRIQGGGMEYQPKRRRDVLGCLLTCLLLLAKLKRTGHMSTNISKGCRVTGWDGRRDPPAHFGVGKDKKACFRSELDGY